MSTHEEWTISKSCMAGNDCWMADRGDEEYGVSLTVKKDGTLDVDVDGALVVKSVPVTVLVDLLRAAGVLP